MINKNETTYIVSRERYEKFYILLKAGVFDVESGKVEINCHNNQIQNIHIHKLVYKKVAKNDIIK